MDYARFVLSKWEKNRYRVSGSGLPNLFDLHGELRRRTQGPAGLPLMNVRLMHLDSRIEPSHQSHRYYSWSSSDDDGSSALRSSIRATSRRRSAAAVHVVESGPEFSSRPERPAATGFELELGGRCPRICPSFGWHRPHPLRRSPCSGILRASCVGPPGRLLDILGPPGTSRDRLPRSSSWPANN